MEHEREQAKDLICLLVAAAGGELHKKVALFKAFYYVHLFYWQQNQTALTDYPIVRMPQGPGIDDHAALLGELQAEGRLAVTREPYGPYSEYRYQILGSFTLNPEDPKYQAAEKAIQFVQGKTAAQLSEETHAYSRSWQQGADGDTLNVYIDLLDDDQYRSMTQSLRQAQTLVDEIFA